MDWGLGLRSRLLIAAGAALMMGPYTYKRRRKPLILAAIVAPTLRIAWPSSARPTDGKPLFRYHRVMDGFIGQSDGAAYYVFIACGGT